MSEAGEKAWVPLTARERRVLGVLVEKAKTTPEYYPLSIAALVTGCNQKSNRDPITNYDGDDVEEILEGLRRKGAAVRVEGSGRVIRWKHTMYDWLDMRNKPVEAAVLTELLLRGPQTEGDLRARAGRMEAIPDLATLQAVLEALKAKELVVRLSPPGAVRGVVVTHAMYPPDEFEKVKAAFAASAAAMPAEEPRAPRAEGQASGGGGWAAEAAALRGEVETLRGELETLRAEVRGLKDALGA